MSPKQHSSSSPHTALVHRRQLITGASAIGALALTGCYGDTTYETGRGMYTLWNERANRFEAPGVYTAAQPGKWAGKEATHAPIVQVYNNGGVLNVAATVNHVMNVSHWITTMYFKDQNYNIFYLQELLPADAMNADGTGAQIYTTLPEGVTQVMAFAYCNEHDHWRSEFVQAVDGAMG
jgi:desulfoferrodoxin (superoxide reductase-like protein)